MKKLFSFLFILFGLCAYRAAGSDYLQTVPLPGNECVGTAAVLRSGDAISAGVDFTSNDIILFKLNSAGVITKSQRISGLLPDEAQTVIATSDGGAAIVGSTSSFGAGNSDAFILKIRRSGTIAWKRVFGTSGNEHFVKVVQTSDRGFIVLGDADHDPNLNDAVVVKFNSKGRPLWRKTISAGAFDHASGMALTSDNGVIVAIAAGFPEGVRSVLVKFGPDGSVQWSRIYGSSGDHLALSVFQAPDGSYYFTEIHTPSGSQRSKTVLSKLNATGVPVWSRAYQSSGVNLAASVTALKAGESILLAGNTTNTNGSNSRGILIGLNEKNGKVLWRKRVRPDTRPVFIGQPTVQTRDQSILVAGCVGERESNNLDSILLKVQGNGTIQGGCSKLSSFPLSSARFQLTSSEFTVEEIPVPFFDSSAGFNVTNFNADESTVCSGE